MSSSPVMTGTQGETADRRTAAWSAVLLVLRAVLAVTFGYAAYTKFLDMRTFAEEVANYQLLPASFVAPGAVSMVGIEVIAALMLLIGLRVRAAAGVVVALLLIFIVALSQALSREIDLRCGCFGGIEPATWYTVWRDAALLVPAALLFIKGGGRFGIDRT